VQVFDVHTIRVGIYVEIRKNAKLLYLKGGLFVFTGLFASALLFLESPSVKVAAFMAIAIWSFARAYYFAFYVVQHYADPGYRFAGLWSFVRYAWSRRARVEQPRIDAKAPE
jgi:hypothetical protein